MAGATPRQRRIGVRWHRHTFAGALIAGDAASLAAAAGHDCDNRWRRPPRGKQHDHLVWLAYNDILARQWCLTRGMGSGATLTAPIRLLRVTAMSAEIKRAGRPRRSRRRRTTTWRASVCFYTATRGLFRAKTLPSWRQNGTFSPFFAVCDWTSMARGVHILLQAYPLDGNIVARGIYAAGLGIYRG